MDYAIYAIIVLGNIYMACMATHVILEIIANYRAHKIKKSSPVYIPTCHVIKHKNEAF